MKQYWVLTVVLTAFSVGCANGPLLIGLTAKEQCALRDMRLTGINLSRGSQVSSECKLGFRSRHFSPLSRRQGYHLSPV